jgi:hypothetical protein
MRVILEMSEGESRSVSVERHIRGGDGASATATATPEAVSVIPSEANNGGAPSDGLLLALGAMAAGDGDESLQEMEARAGGTAAGGSPEWLVQVIKGGNA